MFFLLLCALTAGEHILIATPAYDAQVSSHYTTSLIDTQLFLMSHGIQMTLRVIPNQIVTRARNILTHMFRKEEVFSHMLFIDADIVWKPEHVLMLLQHKKDAVVAAYPVKQYHWDRLSEATKPSDMLGSATSLVNPYANPDTGLLPAKFAATGFMLLTRSAVESVVPLVDMFRYPINGHDEQLANLFDCQVVDGEYLTEDYYFTELYRRTGGTIYVDVRIPLGHMGNHKYQA